MADETPPTVVLDHATWHADYLRGVTASDWAQRYKRRTYELLDARPGARILDLGCGLGDDVRALAAIVGPTVASSASTTIPRCWRAMLERRDAHVAYVQGDAHPLPWSDASFDGARIDRVLQHVRDAEGIVREMARVLRRDGRAVVVGPTGAPTRWICPIVRSRGACWTRAPTRTETVGSGVACTACCTARDSASSASSRSWR